MVFRLRKNHALLFFITIRTQLVPMENTILVTGGAGFIGSNFILQWIEREGTPVVNLDKLTYAGNPRNLLKVSSDPRYCFAQGDVCDREFVPRFDEAAPSPRHRAFCG